MIRAVRRSGERGAGTVLVLGVVLTIATALLAVSVLASGYLARRQAASAADLAALAAATRLADGGGDPCRTAAEIAAANFATLRQCAVQGFDVEVAVWVAVPGPMHWLPDQERRARAGPSYSPPG